MSATQVQVVDWEPGQDKIDISGFQNPAHAGSVWEGRDAAPAYGDQLHVAYHWANTQGEWNNGRGHWNTVVEFRSPATGGAAASLTLWGKYELTPADFIAGPMATPSREGADEHQEATLFPAPLFPAPLFPAPPPVAPKRWADEHQAQAARLYDTVFDRKPDTPGLEFWHASLGHGHGLHEVAGLFTAAPEFQTKYGVLDNAGFVARLYRNALDRNGEREGLDFWTAALDQHRADRSQIVVGFSESPEHAANVTAAQFLI